MPLNKNITHVFEPTPLQCGQAVLSMLTGLSTEEICEITGTERETTLKQMLYCLDKCEIKCKPVKKEIKKGIELPGICVLSLETPKCWHWSLYYKGKFLDPEYGVLDDFPPSNRKYYWEIEE